MGGMTQLLPHPVRDHQEQARPHAHIETLNLKTRLPEVGSARRRPHRCRPPPVEPKRNTRLIQIRYEHPNPPSPPRSPTPSPPVRAIQSRPQAQGRARRARLADVGGPACAEGRGLLRGAPELPRQGGDPGPAGAATDHRREDHGLQQGLSRGAGPAHDGGRQAPRAEPGRTTRAPRPSSRWRTTCSSRSSRGSHPSWRSRRPSSSRPTRTASGDLQGRRAHPAGEPEASRPRSRTCSARCRPSSKVAKAREETLLDNVNQLRRRGAGSEREGDPGLDLQREAESNQQLYEAVLKRFKETGVAGGLETNNVRVVEDARRGCRPAAEGVEPLRERRGWGFSWCRRVRHRLLRHVREDPRRCGALPRASRDRRGSAVRRRGGEARPARGRPERPGEPHRRDDPRSPASEAYRALRTNIQFAGLDQPVPLHRRHLGHRRRGQDDLRRQLRRRVRPGRLARLPRRLRSAAAEPAPHLRPRQYPRAHHRAAGGLDAGGRRAADAASPTCSW